jgi:hypothetical protein
MANGRRARTREFVARQLLAKHVFVLLLTRTIYRSPFRSRNLSRLERMRGARIEDQSVAVAYDIVDRDLQSAAPSSAPAERLRHARANEQGLAHSS